VILTVDGPGDRLRGYRYFWLKYITGYNLSQHCAKSFRGVYSPNVGITMALRRPVAVNEAPFEVAYLCGNTGTWEKNLHLALVPAPGRQVIRQTHHGYRVIVTDAIDLEIPPLPDGWKGLGPEFTTCRNFQFAVARVRGDYPQLPEVLEPHVQPMLSPDDRRPVRGFDRVRAVD
jgi:hypothetical protein